MLSRKNRLSKQADFDLVFRAGRAQKNRNLTIFFRENQQKNSRLAVVVSAKVAKSAVARNKFRRRTYEIFSKLEELMDRKNQDMVLVAKAPAMELSFQELEENILALLRKGGLYA